MEPILPSDSRTDASSPQGQIQPSPTTAQPPGFAPPSYVGPTTSPATPSPPATPAAAPPPATGWAAPTYPPPAGSPGDPTRPYQFSGAATGPPSPTTASATTRPGRWVALTSVLALAAGVVGGVVGATVVEPKLGPTAPLLGSPRPAPLGTIPRTGDIGDLVARVEQSVVSVQTGTGQGTGVILTPDGEILTNAHVVEGARLLTVTVPGESQSRRVDVIDADTDGDLALLRIRDASGLMPADLGTSSDLRAGEDVVAIGNALGIRGDPSVTRGIVSGLGRSIDTLTGLIQTDAAINPGNSGGPLVNSAGEVVGINTAVRGGAQNIGFAIPIDTAMTFVARARTGDPAPVGGFLGLTSRNPQDGSPGAEVMSVEPGSAAGDAGIRPGDRILALDNKPVTGSAELGGIIRSRVPGDKVTVRIFRNGAETSLVVTLGERT